jgi:hypothetical protein
MDQTFSMPTNNHRLGMHYFPDTDHFQQSDLNIWLPELKALGIQWLTIIAPIGKAIPEPFIRRLIKNGIEPVLHFNANLKNQINLVEFEFILQAYSNWGVKYISLFDKPNLFSQWGENYAHGSEIVTSFMQTFLPIAEIAAELGFFVGFPPLEPGGNYWDTTFIRQSLQKLKDMGRNNVLNRLFLTAYGWAGNRPFDWGSGGPEQWPGARPYHTPEGEEDQFGLRIFDWYNAESAAILGDPLPIMLTACGSKIGAQTDNSLPLISVTEHGYRNLQIARLLARQTNGIPEGAAEMEIPENVISGNFWTLSSTSKSPDEKQAWYAPNGERLPIVEKMKAWVKSSGYHNLKRVSHQKNIANLNNNRSPSENIIDHYLLIPQELLTQEKRIFKKLEKFLALSRPTIGFSLEEAKHANHVTMLVGKNTDFHKEKLDLIKNNCFVDLINLNGTVVAN